MKKKRKNEHEHKNGIVKRKRNKISKWRNQSRGCILVNKNKNKNKNKIINVLSNQNNLNDFRCNNITIYKT